MGGLNGCFGKKKKIKVSGGKKGKNGKKKTGHNALKAHIFYLYTGKYITAMYLKMGIVVTVAMSLLTSDTRRFPPNFRLYV